jgi:hypothetical protein
MALVGYESLRSRLSHAMLANGCFSYLSEPPAYWRMETLSVDFRINTLVNNWREISKRTNSLRQAYKTWSGDAEKDSIYATTLQLYDLVHRDAIVTPTDAFPSLPVITGWLSEMTLLMDSLAEAEFTYDSDQISKVRAFWTAGLALYQWLQDIRFGSEHFWTYLGGKA